jgi:hypothetical protein
VLLQHKSLKRCSEALNRLGGALAYWANGYESRDRKPGRSPDGAQDLHCMANRFVSWFDQPIASSDELRRHRQEARDLEEYHEQSVADIYAQLMGAAVDWVLVSFKSAPPNNPQAEQSESVNLNNPL